MEKNILIIGSEGFIGKSFIDYYFIYGEPQNKLYSVDIKDINEKNYYKCDITHFEDLNDIIHKINPDIIYNFSGSFTNNFDIDYSINVIGTKNIFDSIILNNYSDCRILVNGSSAEYGLIKEFNNPINEDYPLNPINFYGLSKTYQTFLAKTYFHRYDLKIFITRPFNIIGYGISNKLFIGRLLEQIKTNLEKKSKIVLGNLSSYRDYLDIEDLIRAYEKIVNNGKPGEIYNIGTGSVIKIRDLLNIFLYIFNIDESFIEINESLISKYDIPKIIADNSKLVNLDWQSQISLENSIIKIREKITNKK